MSTESYSNCQPQPNPCVYEIPITLKVPIQIDIEVCTTNQLVPPQIIVVPVQPNLQLTPKVESRQPECLYPAQNGGYHQLEQQYAATNS